MNSSYNFQPDRISPCEISQSESPSGISQGKSCEILRSKSPTGISQGKSCEILRSKSPTGISQGKSTCQVFILITHTPYPHKPGTENLETVTTKPGSDF